jgi:hypothetical protein
MSIDLQDPARAARLFPGTYERNTRTSRQPGSMAPDPSAVVPIGSGSMDAATIADREREGGGAPNQRRRKAQLPARTGPALLTAVHNGSWFTGGGLWLQILRLAGR